MNAYIGAMIGRLHHVVLDCPDPGDSRRSIPSCRDSRLRIGARLPTWPDPTVPQQVHLDVMVEEVATSARQVLELGATKLDGENVYADPAGHPFCLIRRPGWAAPIPVSSTP